jgi:hypothetical protein
MAEQLGLVCGECWRHRDGHEPGWEPNPGEPLADPWIATCPTCRQTADPAGRYVEIGPGDGYDDDDDVHWVFTWVTDADVTRGSKDEFFAACRRGELAGVVDYDPATGLYSWREPRD